MGFTKETARKGGKASKRGKAKTTIEIRNTFTSILSDNETNIQKWLNKTAEQDPARALDLIIKLASFVISKPKIEAVTEMKEQRLFVDEDLSLLSDEELDEQLHQSNRVLHSNYCSKTRTFKPMNL